MDILAQIVTQPLEGYQGEISTQIWLGERKMNTYCLVYFSVDSQLNRTIRA